MFPFTTERPNQFAIPLRSSNFSYQITFFIGLQLKNLLRETFLQDNSFFICFATPSLHSVPGRA
jgi:hypothetical protein